MHSRAVRTSAVALLLVSGAAAAVLWWRYDAETRVVEARARALDAIVERALPAAADIAAAQRAYVDFGLRDEATFARIGDLLAQLTTDAARFRLAATSPTSRARIDEALAALSALTTAAGRARAEVQAGDPLSAAEAVLGSDAQQQIATLTTALRAYHAAERQWLHDRRATLEIRLRAIVAGIAVLWTVVIVTMRRARHDVGPSRIEAPALADLAPTVASSSTAGPPPIDIAAAADVCVSIAQLDDAASLSEVLERAAAVLDARGVVVWMGAGDELFAAAGWGYERGIMQRLRPIPRGADNATAAAWRTAELRAVPGDATTPGAIVAPMCGPDGCIGVLAAEVRNGRETDAGTRAVATIIAAQLSGVLSAWPAASTATGRRDETAAGAEGRGSERNTAALR